MDVTAREQARSDADGAAGALIDSALQLRWRAPEIALLLADRAATEAAGDDTAALRAEHLAAASLNALDRGVEVVARSLPTVRRAGAGDDLGPLRVELAAGASDAGDPAAALVVLDPVLVAGAALPPQVQAGALVQAGAALTVLGRREEGARALAEADLRYQADPDADTTLLRAALRVHRATGYRRDGDLAASEVEVRGGLDLLAGLPDPDHDGGQIRARLLLERVLGLLDRGEPEAALREAEPVCQGPVRAAVANPVGWLRLALATRVHLPAGRHEPAVALLADAVRAAERHQLDAVLAECLDGLSQLHEARGELVRALECLRSARAAAYRRLQAVDAARAALAEERVAARWSLPELVERVAALVGVYRPVPGSPRTDENQVATTLAAAEAEPEPEPEPIAAQSVPTTQHPATGEQPVGATRARHRRDGGQQVPVAELLHAAALASGDRFGRRHAEDRASSPTDQAADDDPDPRNSVSLDALTTEPPLGSEQVLGELAEGSEADPARSINAGDESARPAAGAPPLDWPIDGTVPEESEEVGLGDLLAEALAAFQEVRRSREADAGPRSAVGG